MLKHYRLIDQLKNIGMNCSFMNYSKWMLWVNEANERVNKIKWSSSLCDWKMNQIDNENKRKRKTLECNCEQWKLNEQWWKMNDKWWRMNNKWWRTNDEWQTFSLLLIPSISLSHLLTNLLCHTLFVNFTHTITQSLESITESLNQSIIT